LAPFPGSRPAAYGVAIQELKAEGKLPQDTAHRQVKYLNNVVEADRGKLKRLIKPTLSFKSMKTAYATIKGFEAMRSLKKGQTLAFQYQQGLRGEVRLVERCFNLIMKNPS
jgi:IS6 family transposase